MPLSEAESIGTFDASDPEIEHMLIGLIADTHIPTHVKLLPPHVKEAFKEVDLILHAGDIYSPEVLDELETIAPVLAARGNGDINFPQDHRLSENHVLSIARLHLGLTHSIYYLGSPEYFGKVTEREFGMHMDVVIFGDTHVATVERYNGVLLVNPGSPALPNNCYELGTVGLLEIAQGSYTARIVQLNEFSLPFHRKLVYY